MLRKIEMSNRVLKWMHLVVREKNLHISRRMNQVMILMVLNSVLTFNLIQGERKDLKLTASYQNVHLTELTIDQKANMSIPIAAGDESRVFEVSSSVKNEIDVW